MGGCVEKRTGDWGLNVNEILQGYAAHAKDDLVSRYEAISSRQVYAPVLDLLPVEPVRIADVGAGTGRDAAWFAELGHRVVAVEPVEELRVSGMARHSDSPIEWLDDRLPELEKAQALGPFDLVTLCAVWQHIDDDARQLALANLAQMTSAGGRLVMSLRHGPGAKDRKVFPISADSTIDAAGHVGFELLRRAEAASVQAANQANGVFWTWLVFRKAD
jgi:2-polyprenyl-3-methyl-5-hydroxy-6-metoxy-1,4-benzoquinol methylase